MNACSHARYGQCTCRPDDPRVGSTHYAAARRHVDAGDLDALRRMTAWLAAGEPFCHVRYADGEFASILGAAGANCDGQPYLPDTLGVELAVTLARIAVRERGTRVLVGGDWRRPVEAWDWLTVRHLHRSVPWCPSQVFVNGIMSGDSRAFLRALHALPGRRYLVANGATGPAVASGLDATVVEVPARGAYPAGTAHAGAFLGRVLAPGDVVLYAAGLGCKPTAWRLFVACPGTSHVDVGCFLDAAAGLRSRSWLQDDEDERVVEYRRSILPLLNARGVR